MNINEQDEYDQQVGKMRSQGDEKAFVAAWEGGTALGLDEVLASPAL
jgi:hypothetical protein